MVVPMYNEVERFAEAWPELERWIADAPEGSELIFVDDGSTDGTADLVERTIADAPKKLARCIRNPHLGKGAAVRAGLLAATTPIAGFCDVDLSTPLSASHHGVVGPDVRPQGFTRSVSGVAPPGKDARLCCS